MSNETSSSQSNAPQINTGRLKHLEMLQQIITRMASNSFLVKGWSVTLLSAILVLTAQGKVYAMGWVAVIPVAAFWLLDGFFLRQERLFRKLYDRYRSQPQDMPTDFSMDTSVVSNEVGAWGQVMVSPALLIFHGGLAILLAITLLLSRCKLI
ncbi:MAG: hypothetical protein HYR55_13015 [Acidobacteria bacterium]|nr:hypothetical protein [Acidobacteriota bacterium]MBI3657878.1 hypothetical protein [Acidobacteriota bacterium]